jgi:hypothetical protein
MNHTGQERSVQITVLVDGKESCPATITQMKGEEAEVSVNYKPNTVLSAVLKLKRAGEYTGVAGTHTILWRIRKTSSWDEASPVNLVHQECPLFTHPVWEKPYEVPETQDY